MVIDLPLRDPADGQNMAVVVDADQLVAERADQDFRARIVRIVGQRLPVQNDLRGLPARLRDGLHAEIARRQPARDILCEILDKLSGAFHHNLV